MPNIKLHEERIQNFHKVFNKSKVLKQKKRISNKHTHILMVTYNCYTSQSCFDEKTKTSDWSSHLGNSEFVFREILQ